MRRIHDVRRGFEYLFPKAAADCVIIGGYALERTPFMGEGAVRRKPNRAPFLEGSVKARKAVMFSLNMGVLKMLRMIK